MFAAHCVAIWTHRRRDVSQDVLQDVSQDVLRDVLPGFAGRSAGRFTRFAQAVTHDLQMFCGIVW